MSIELINKLKEEVKDLSAKRKDLSAEYAKAYLESVAEDIEDSVKAELEAKLENLDSQIEAIDIEAKKKEKVYKNLSPNEINFPEAKNQNSKELEEMFNKDFPKLEKKSPTITLGHELANAFKGLGLTYDVAENLVDTQRQIKFTVVLDDNDADAKIEVKKEKLVEAKSLYVNGGTDLGVPGFQGSSCVIWRMTDECNLCSAPDTFQDCVTVMNMPAAGVVEYNYPISRVSAAAGVLETVYHPGSTLLQDGTKPEGTFTFGTIRERVKKIAVRVTVSEEAWEDCPQTANRIDFYLADEIDREKRRQMIQGNGTNELRGILNWPGTVPIDATVAGQINGQPIGVTNPTMADKLAVAKNILEQNCATVDCIIVNPTDKVKLMLLKDTQGRYLFPQDNCEMPSLWCVSVKTSVNVPVGTVILGELKNNWTLLLRKALTVSVGYVGNQFAQNAQTILAEMRGVNILKCPNRVGIMTGFN